MNNYCVYFYLREDGSPYYVGMGRKQRPFARHAHREGKGDFKPNDRDLIFIAHENLSQQEAYDLEIMYIKEYGRKCDGGILINLTEGGQGALHNEETRKKLSQQRIGVKNPMYGLEVSKEHRLKISLANTNPSKEVRERKRIGQINRHYSEDTLNSLLEDFSKMDKIVHGVTYKMLANKYNITPRMVSENWRKYKKNK